MGRVKVPARARVGTVDSSDLSPLSGCGAAKTANCLDLVFCSGEDGWVDSTAQCHSPGDAWQHSTAHTEGTSVTGGGCQNSRSLRIVSFNAPGW
jgi:hypothetical protein